VKKEPGKGGRRDPSVENKQGTREKFARLTLKSEQMRRYAGVKPGEGSGRFEQEEAEGGNRKLVYTRGNPPKSWRVTRRRETGKRGGRDIFLAQAPAL